MNLRQLAEKLNLSQTTVSRALNGYPEVNETTRKRVLDAAARYHYRPNYRARGLATGRAMSIGHVIPASNQPQMVNMIFADFIAGAGEVYARHGYDMVISMVRDEDELRAYRGVAEKGAVDGILVHSPTCDDPRIALLSQLEIPFLVHGRSSRVRSDYSWLDVNNARAFERATRHLIGLGHRRIALVNGQEQLDFALRRRAGYLKALRDSAIAPDSILMRTDEMSEPYGHVTASELLDLPDPPTAFLASSVVPALGIRRAIEERGLVMGRDVSIICFDDRISYLPNGLEAPIFTAMRSSIRAAGRRCAELLIDRIARPDSTTVTELWEAEFVQGQSTGPAPG
ncbi:substrate-binding domain-containing protein [Sulfitobacter sp. D35]|uniref:substrate-binding domain-containing protein n=1 Tax=Sulfitobacter sp. D35 TaxID=3083252 RepID=UPI00296F5097|nr:substrate-binding domain-containing protein [Sulfitobacter sp. D35]MDW4498833.1 substrate-binding domain-containing protein [Sulfitobacter sp. D35]